MSSNYYALYIENVLQLAETIVIKSAEAAEAINLGLQQLYGSTAVDTTDPRSWKYYLNISGQYHPRDQVMTVVSLDTLQEITFSKENLQIHRATLRGYAYGTREYRQLVSRYPDQEMLILGILYPVDIDRAIAAKNFQILGYPSALVEANEYSFIENLQQWINAFVLRWVNAQFNVSDDLYAATALGVLYLNLVPAILNLRLAACKTNEAHSYHVRQFLASHGMLDVYLDNLTLKQALWLYRNIPYIERNSGQRNIFEWLVEHIMTERNLPLAEYVMRHDLSAQPTDIYPTLQFKRRSINPPQSNVVRDHVDLSTLLIKEDPLALANVQAREDQQVQIQQQFENSSGNVVHTKALESAMIDYSNAVPYTLEETLLNHWLWLSSNGYYYQAVVAITNPKTGERIPMMVKDAFVFMWYAFCASIGIHLDTIPKLYAKRVQRIPTPSVDAIMQVAEAAVLPRSFAQQVHDWMPTLQPMISTEAFYNTAVQIQQAASWQASLIADQEHQLRRGYALGVVSQLWSDNICQLAEDGYTYDAWFSARNIRIADFTQDDLGVAYLSITKDATGMSLHTTNSLRNLQKAMVNLLGQLSSYSVQFLTEINNTDIRVGNLAAVRVGNVKGTQHDHQHAVSLVVEPQHLAGRSKDQTLLELGAASVGSNNSERLRDYGRLDIDVQPELSKVGAIYHYRMEAAPVYVHSAMTEVPSQGGVVPVLGVEAIYPLTAEERGLLRDVYRLWDTGAPLQSNDLSSVLQQIHLPGFDWQAPNLGVVLTVDHLPGFGYGEVNPPTPTVDANQRLSYMENLVAGGIIGNVSVSNAGFTAGFRFADSQAAVSADGYFQIDAQGQVTITQTGVSSAVNDFEVGPLDHIYAIQVADLAGRWSPAVNVTFGETDDPRDNVPSNLTVPVLSGSATLGNVLTVTQGTWQSPLPLTFQVQWKLDGVAIAGATGYSFTTPADLSWNGQQISAEVTALNSTGGTTASSNALTLQAPVAPPAVADVGNFTPAAGQRIVGWNHPSNAGGLPALSFDTVSQRFLLQPGPNLEVPVVHFDNVVAAGNFSVSVSCVSDGQSDANFLQVVRNGTDVLGTVAQGASATFNTTLGLYDTLEVQLMGAQIVGGANYAVLSISKGAQSWNAQSDFWNNLGVQTSMWKYFYRDRTGAPQGATNSSGPMQPTYAAQ